VLAIIPARGGSKGLPGKNVKLLGGKPLIHWTIEAAMRSKYIDRVVLSTDDRGIAELCASTGIEMPFFRPDELATDESLAVDVYCYTVDRMQRDHKLVEDEYVVLLPTVPFRSFHDIDLAIEMYRENNADSVISGKKVDFPVEWLLSVDPKTKQISGADLAKISGKNRQSFEQQFIPNGGIYVLKHHLVKAQKSYYFNKTLFYEMPEERSIDIDVGYDFKLAEFFLEQMQSENL